jgi:hypothetical protein
MCVGVRDENTMLHLLPVLHLFTTQPCATQPHLSPTISSANHNPYHRAIIRGTERDRMGHVTHRE